MFVNHCKIESSKPDNLLRQGGMGTTRSDRQRVGRGEVCCSLLHLPSFMPEGLDRIHHGGFPGGINSEDHSNHKRNENR